MAKQINSANAVIDELGGTAAVAKIFGVDSRVVSNWRVRGLPPETFVALSSALNEKNMSAPASLWKMREAIS